MFGNLTVYENVQIARIEMNKKTFSLFPVRDTYLKQEVAQGSFSASTASLSRILHACAPSFQRRILPAFALSPGELPEAEGVLRAGLLLEHLVGHVGGRQDRGVHPADPAGSHDIDHLAIHQRGDFLHIGGAFLADQSIFCPVDGYGEGRRGKSPPPAQGLSG